MVFCKCKYSKWTVKKNKNDFSIFSLIVFSSFFVRDYAILHLRIIPEAQPYSFYSEKQ